MQYGVSIVVGLPAFSLLALCLAAAPATAPSTQSASSFQVIGRISSPAIRESSGVVASRRFPDVLWTHNDGGNGSFIFAITRAGRLLARYAVGAPEVDWEDIAIDDSGRLYIADIGNNFLRKRTLQVYRVPEPDPRALSASGEAPRVTLRPDRVWQVTYPGAPFNAESFFIVGGHGYVVEKNVDGAEAGVYRFALDPSPRVEPIALERVATIPLRWPVASADASCDGKYLAVMTLVGPFVYGIDGEVARVSGAEPLWQATFLDPTAEGLCFVPDGLIATTEARRVVLFPWRPPATTSAP
jgi:hypothetical protein